MNRIKLTSSPLVPHSILSSNGLLIFFLTITLFLLFAPCVHSNTVDYYLDIEYQQEPDGFSKHSPIPENLHPDDQNARPERRKREARGGRGSSFRGSSSRGSRYTSRSRSTGTGYRNSRVGGSPPKLLSSYKRWNSHVQRALVSITYYIQPAKGGRMAISTFKKGYKIATAKKTSISVNPKPIFLRNNQPRSKIESSFNFKPQQSDALVYTIYNSVLKDALFRLVLIGSEQDSSNIYVGYYEPDKEYIVSNPEDIDTTPSFHSIHTITEEQDTRTPDVITNHSAEHFSQKSTLAPFSITNTPVNYSVTPTSAYNTGNVTTSEVITIKQFKSFLTLKKGQDYFIDFVWKPASTTISSISMPDSASTLLTTSEIMPSATTSIQTVSSVYMAQNETQILPTAIPEDASAQIIIRDKDNNLLKVLNLNLSFDHFSLNNNKGKMLDYSIQGSKIKLLTTIHKDNSYWYRRYNNSRQNSLSTPLSFVALLSLFLLQ